MSKHLRASGVITTHTAIRVLEVDGDLDRVLLEWETADDRGRAWVVIGLDACHITQDTTIS